MVIGPYRVLGGNFVIKVSYVIPEVSTTNAPNPKNGGTEIQREKIQMKAMIRKEVLYEVILYVSGLVMIKSL